MLLPRQTSLRRRLLGTTAARSLLARLRGHRHPPGAITLADLSAEDRAIVERAMPYTMTGVPRLAALVEAVRYCIGRNIPGAFAECGVWLGGSILAMILTLQAVRADDRDVYLFDTFTGMTQPTDLDISRYDPPALKTWRTATKRRMRPWSFLFDSARFSEDNVRATIAATRYARERVHFVVGRVEQTLPAHAPAALALMRLDTDWYESTRHELHHLYPRLSPGGVLIVDDYGHWQGARRAVDEYFAELGPAPLLAPIDYGARIAIKPAPE